MVICAAHRISVCRVWEGMEGSGGREMPREARLGGRWLYVYGWSSGGSDASAKNNGRCRAKLGQGRRELQKGALFAAGLCLETTSGLREDK